MPYDQIIPTQYERPGASLTPRTKFRVDIEHPPSMQALQADEEDPSYERLMANARGTLDHANPMQGELNLIEQNVLGTRPARGEDFAPRPTTTYRDVADQTFGAGGFIPGPVGAASRMASGALGAYDMATEGPSLGNVAQTAFGALELAGPAMKALRGSRLKSVNVGAHGPANAPIQGAARPPMDYKFNTRSTGTPAPSSAPSMAALGDDAVEGGMIGEIDLTDAINSASATPLSPKDIAQARAAERFGKTYRSEQTVPSAAPQVSATYLGRQPGLSGDDDAVELYNLVGGDRHGSTVSAETLRSMGIEVPPAVDNGQMAAREAAIRRLVTSAYGDNPSPSVSRMTAAEALADDSVIGMTKKGKPITASSIEQNNPVMGGASSREYGSGDEAGDFVAPKNRTPIGKTEGKTRKPWIPASWEAIVGAR